jgi:hypothetical protein
LSQTERDWVLRLKLDQLKKDDVVFQTLVFDVDSLLWRITCL